MMTVTTRCSKNERTVATTSFETFLSSSSYDRGPGHGKYKRITDNDAWLAEIIPTYTTSEMLIRGVGEVYWIQLVQLMVLLGMGYIDPLSGRLIRKSTFFWAASAAGNHNELDAIF